MRYGCLVPHPPLIVDGIGKGEIPDTVNAYKKVSANIEKLNPETVVIISPHSVMYDDYFHIAPRASASGDFGAFGVKSIKFNVEYDEEFANSIGEFARKEGLQAGPHGAKTSSLDHGVMVPLYFIKAKKIVRLSLSGFSAIGHYRLGMCIAKAGEHLNRNFVIVASGDMSHKLKEEGPYGFAPEGPKFDNLVCEYLEKKDFRALISIDPALCEKAAECGYKSLAILLGAFDGFKLNADVLCYEGPFGVGYLTAEFTANEKQPSLLPLLLKDRDEKLEKIKSCESEYVSLARKSVESYVRAKIKLICPKELPKGFYNKRAGVFVSIKKDGKLRGCIGTIMPTQVSIAEEIIQNAVSAAVGDPRFYPVDIDELDSLVYSVDVLSPSELIKDKKELDVNRYGVIVRHNGKSGLLLPALEGVETVEEQISIALKKAGIKETEPYTLERFEVTRYK